MSLGSEIAERLRSLLFRGREERELREELEFHVEMEARQQQRSGVSAAEARRHALIALGGMEQVREDVRGARGTRLLEESIADVRYALRSLARRPGFTAIAILTLAVGIGGTVAVFSAVDAVLLRPLPYQEPGQLVRLYQEYAAAPGERSFVTPVHYLAFRERMASFESAAAILTYNTSGGDIGAGDRARRVRVLPTSADYLHVLRAAPRLGRGFERAEENGAGVVILSHALWHELFKDDPSAIGQSLTLSGKPAVIVGVMPEDFADPLVPGVDAWVPLDLTPGRDPDNVQNHYLTLVARLRPGVTLAQAQAELDAVIGTLGREYPTAKDDHARLYPLKQDIVGGSTTALAMMLGAVVLVLLLVCVNMANLLLVRGSERAREFAVRSAIGAGRGRLLRQLLLESVVLALVGDAAGLLVARLGMAGLIALGSGSIPRIATLTLDSRVLGFSIGLATLSAVLFGLAPALRASQTDPGGVLREETRSSTGNRRQGRVREALVVSQVALAFVLLVGAGLLVASFQRLRETDLGVRPAGVLTFELNLPDARYDSTARGRFFEEFAARVMTLPGVEAAGGVSKLPATGRYHQWGTEALSGPLARTRESSALTEERIVSGDYFRTLGIPLLHGRLFDGRDVAGAPDAVIISQSLASRLFPGTEPIGQRINTGGRESDVIGVVGEVAVDPEGNGDLYVYHAHAQFAGDRNWSLAQVVSSALPRETLEPQVRRILAEMDPQLVLYQPMMLDEAIGRGEAQRLFTLRILASFAAVALALAALGLFGVLSCGVTLRTREFGIRMALGADRGRVRAMVLRQGLGVTALGMLAGLLGAVAMSKLMALVVYRVSPLEPRVLLAAALFVALVAAAAAYLPAYRATKVDPRSALQ